MLWLLASTVRQVSTTELTWSAALTLISAVVGGVTTYWYATRDERKARAAQSSDSAVEHRRLLDASQQEYRQSILARLERTEARLDEAEQRADEAEAELWQAKRDADQKIIDAKRLADIEAGELRREFDEKMKALEEEFNRQLRLARQALRAVQRQWRTWYDQIPPDIVRRLPEPPQTANGES